METLINYDKQLLLFLHSKGSLTWDTLWLFITNPLHWIPLFFIIFFLGYKALGGKKASIIMVITALNTGTALIIVNLIKNAVQRIRPINDVSINNTIRVLIDQNDFSFVSGHSAVSFTIAFITFWVLKKHYKFIFLIFLFPMLFAYSRIYLAAHFPVDIVFGMFLGYVLALVFYKIIKVFMLKK